MSSLTLPSQSFRPAQPLAGRAVARALTTAIATLAAPLRGALAAMIAAAEVRELRDRSQAHRATKASYAADLAAAADRYTVVEQA